MSISVPLTSLFLFYSLLQFLLIRKFRNHELAQIYVRYDRPFPVVVTDRFDAGSLSAVVGTEEPIYGPEAIQSVAQQAETTSFSDVNKDILRWRAYSYTNVETQTFYIMADNGTVVFVQVIYSNIV